MTYTKLLTNDEIFALFENEFGSFYAVAQESTPSLSQDLPHFYPTAARVYGFKFATTDRLHTFAYMLVSHDGLELQFWSSKEKPLLMDFGKELGGRSDYFEPASVLNLTELVHPVDEKPDGLDRRANKVTIVRLPEGEIVSLMIWFEFGSRLALVTGSLHELMLVFGEQVDILYEQAIENGGRVKVESESFRPPNYKFNLLASINWFEYP